MHATVGDDQANAARGGDVRQRIAFDDDHVRQLADFDRPQVAIDVKHTRDIHRCGLKRLEGGHAGGDVFAELDVQRNGIRDERRIGAGHDANAGAMICGDPVVGAARI